MLRKTIYVVVAILALGGFTAFASMSANARSAAAPAVTQSVPTQAPSVQRGGGIHSNLVCIGQFGGRVLGVHVCPLK